ncbi:MAG: phosphate signaling complex protein PhoU [Candidatus Omnitrophica bacterium]|jgi:phosphate transport system protein|nr:phosphate signaling complex protein PhoU [Candidatus Omnitrophota bacterium]MDD3275302.1 phosphate signaling complex protein PhoU [Candidatus Omnitrophota bacterium]MDD5078486.1 phosphate signaling complex protein PhoU [Candidatus Omnitrophota bacterium]MDD5724856.1 phosphate signaling complex protein PhoU [Candidatus Omnitrophota bacterium]
MLRHLDEELKELHKDIMKMATFAQEAIFKSVESLKNRDEGLAQEVIDNDNRIDELELLIDEKCIDLIARYQPMAGDLRYISTGMKINSELERIADIALDIAQRSLDLMHKPLLKPLIDIPKLSQVAQEMVRDAIDAFVKRDSQLARKVVLTDAEADRLRNLVQDEIVDEYLGRDPKTADRAVALLLIARYLERICDHTTNIAEDIIYMVDARVVKHHPEELG